MKSTTVTRVGSVAVALALLVGVAGCTPGALIRSLDRLTSAGAEAAREGEAGEAGPDAGDGSASEGASDAGSSDSGFVPMQVDGPADWSALESCDDGSDSSPWKLVSGFPVAEVDAAGIVPFCGDAFIDESDGFVGAVATVTEQQIFLLGGELTAAGYTLVDDELSTEAYGGTGEYIGGREYARGDDTVVISAYDNGVHPLSLTVFIDFYSDETRAMAAAVES